MAIDPILSQIDAEINRLLQVKKLLAGAANISIDRATAGGRGAKSAKKSSAKTAKRTRVLSPEARKRIADAQKRRWAAQRKAKKSE